MGPLEPKANDLIVAVICFAAVFFTFAKFLVPRITRTLEARQDAIEGTLARSEAVHAEARRIHAEYQAELSEARHEAARIRQAATDDGSLLIQEIRAEGQRQRDELVASARAQLEADRILAEAVLREDVLRLATDLAERILGEPITDERRARETAEAFFAEVDADSSAKA
ncbi:F0F1 ATP synthase subunit B [Streptomyces alanosinicus]|uniref:ATP synthase subunit b n=1 Tax=Streptomyces alanosinicus TaxID=68171 RepID=A0A918YNE4_9ACTN|nr:F0F1 ATP synthase subunit B [Streptomyces alanosinicus]GHE09592.1 ATP synthase subunit b [Streptomyces alanosinicus]